MTKHEQIIKNNKIMSFWDFERNTLDPNTTTCRSRKIMCCKCRLGHIWDAPVYSVARYKGIGCPYCLNHKVLKGFNDLQTTHPDIASEFHPVKNIGKSPDMFTRNSREKIWWLGKCGHEWLASIYTRTHGRNCHYCNSHKILIGFNDLPTVRHDIVLQWHPTKNGDLKPENFAQFSCSRIWWMDEFMHEWVATIQSRSRGKKCPYCSNKKILIGFNDLATTHPKLADEWSDKNTIKSTDVTYGYSKDIIWECHLCGFGWITTVNSRTNNYKPTGCPRCNASKLEKETSNILQRCGYILIDRNDYEPHKYSKLKIYMQEKGFDNCKNKKRLRFDFWLPNENTLIECQGIQHYKKECLRKIGENDTIFNVEKLDKIIKHDKIKKRFCKKERIKLIEIKYDQIDRIEEILIKELGLTER